MGFMGYGTAKLKEKAAKRNMSVEEYCAYLERKKRETKWRKDYDKLPKVDVD